MKRAGVVLIGILLAASLGGNAYLWKKYDGKSKMLNSTLKDYEAAKLAKDSLFQILEEKERILDALKTEKLSSEEMIFEQLASIDALKRKIGFLRRKINLANPAELAKYKDEILALKTQVDQFDSTNNALSAKNNALALNLSENNQKLDVLSTSNKKLTAKITQSAVPIFGPLNVIATYMKRGTKRVTDRKKRVEILEISFDLMENKLLNSAENFNYKFRIIDPRGVVLSNNTSLRDADELFTIEEKVVYDGTPQKVNLKFKNKEEYMVGKYKIILMHEGFAKQEFILELI